MDKREENVPAYGEADVRRWIAEFNQTMVPDLVDQDLTDLPRVIGLKHVASPYGVALRVVTDAGTCLDLFLHPAAAVRVAEAITDVGQQAGWWNPATGGIGVPRIPRSQKRSL